MTIGLPLLVSLAALTAFPLSSQALILASYDFTGGSLAASFQHPSVIAGDITSIVDAGNATLDNSEFATYTTGGNPDGQISDGYNGSSQSSTVNAGEYFSFTLIAAPGETLSLISLTVDARVTSGSGNRVFFVRTSQNAYASSIFSSGDINSTTFSNYVVDLSGLAPVTDSSPLEIRIYTYMEGAGRQMFYDNLTVNAVPEPSAGGLLALAALGLVRRRRL